MTPSQAAAYSKHVKATSVSCFAEGVMKVHIITAKVEGPETVSIKKSFLNTGENLLHLVQVCVLFKS
jgi:6-phosphogluconolactonase/glucosamine-6-phosphate isomerase/deaminase